MILCCLVSTQTKNILICFGLKINKNNYCPVGVRQVCVLSLTIFSLFINQLANYITETGRHGIELLSGLVELFILLFADDVALLATTPYGLQNQLKSLKACCDRLHMEVNRGNTKVMVFPKGGYLSKHEK